MAKSELFSSLCVCVCVSVCACVCACACRPSVCPCACVHRMCNVISSYTVKCNPLFARQIPQLTSGNAWHQIASARSFHHACQDETPFKRSLGYQYFTLGAEKRGVPCSASPVACAGLLKFTLEALKDMFKH